MSDITAGAIWLPARIDLFKRRVTTADIAALTWKYFGLNKAAFMGARRSRCVSRPRQIAMTLVREFTGASLPAIGQYFGGKDHTTVLHACRRIAALEMSDEAVAHDMRTLRARIRAWRTLWCPEIAPKEQPEPASYGASPPPPKIGYGLILAAGTGKDAADAFARTVAFEPRGMGA